MWHVYKIEVDGVLIYIGATSNVANRRGAHSAKRVLPISGGTVSVIASFDTRAAALAAERDAIRKHRPVGNFQSNPVGYKSTKERDLALHKKLNELEAARWARMPRHRGW